jgi:hypothetical protein
MQNCSQSSKQVPDSGKYSTTMPALSCAHPIPHLNVQELPFGISSAQDVFGRGQIAAITASLQQSFH